MARSRKCPECKRTVLADREQCPHCNAPKTAPKSWGNLDAKGAGNLSGTDHRRQALYRMRNGGVVMFVFGIILMANGVVPGPTPQLKPIGGVGVIFIILGTVSYLWSWNTLRND